MPDMSAQALLRLKVRLGNEGAVPGDDELSEVVQGVADRLRMRLRADELPVLAWSVVVDASVKVVRRRFYEGISSESEGQTGSLSTAFFESVLAEYEADIEGLRDMMAAEGAEASVPMVRFV